MTRKTCFNIPGREGGLEDNSLIYIYINIYIFFYFLVKIIPNHPLETERIDNISKLARAFVKTTIPFDPDHPLTREFDR